jgi:hypothetical protein
MSEKNDDAWNHHNEELERQAIEEDHPNEEDRQAAAEYAAEAQRDADEDARDLCERTKEERRKLARDGDGE